MKEQTVKFSDLTFDEELYPRLKTSWFTAYSYAQAMRAGAIFPRVFVGRFKGKLYLVDGWHRVKALGLLKRNKVKAVVKSYRSKKKLFLDAIERNVSHGKQLSMQEKVSLIDRLQRMNFKRVEISKIVRIPIDKIGRFTSRIMRGPAGEVIYLKALTAKITKEDRSMVEGIDQASFSVRRTEELFAQLVEVLESDSIPDTPRAKELAVRLYDLLTQKLQLVKAS